ncbi:uncharacterized protein SPSC_05716 [Sporisorium scitamineum]|uniref:Uncharacterized protein n=1 Tax=Sporisorium scitamineum TaxID=49012 RepID=A0A127Z4X1_9BASI|nr:uncharacterized protein SPSC_05716 [Sporisorium scitamineum]
MYRPSLPDHASAEAGPSRLAPSELPDKPKKRRRLQFTSQLRTNIQRYNPDGTETVEYLHQQSTQRLKRKWDSIFERFKDAHLQEQDEIYLGNRANGEPIVVVKDRGSLRSLRQSMEFGVFIKDEELQGWKDRPEARQMQEQGGGGDDDDDDDDDDDFDPSRVPSHRAQLAGASSSESEDEEDDPAANDPDLREFLQAEARRKAMLGKSGNEESDEEEDDDVVDFADPKWNNYQPSASAIVHSSKQVPKTIRKPDPRAAQAQPPEVDAPDLVLSSSEDDDDTDIVTVHSDSDEELIDSIRTKRQNIEELLQCTTPFETLPYNDIFGLADLLKLTGNTSRLYVDLVSDDENQVESVEADGPAKGTLGKEDVIDLTSSLPNPSLPHSSLPNSSLVADAASSPLSELASSRASSVVPVAPASVRSVTPDASSVDVPLLQLAPVQPTLVHSTPAETTPSEAAPKQAEAVEAPGPVEALSPAGTLSEDEDIPAVAQIEPRLQTRAMPPVSSPPPSLQNRQPSQPESAAAVSPPAVVEASSSEPATPPHPSLAAPPATLSIPAMPSTPEVPEIPAPAAKPATPAPTTQVDHATPSRITPHRETKLSQPTPSRTSSQKPTVSLSAEKQKATPTSSSTCTTSTSATPLSSSRRHVSTPSSHTKHTPSSTERRIQRRRSRVSRSKTSFDDERVGKKARPVCGGPTKCRKSFCLLCASLSR